MPTAGITYSKLTIDGYTETGAGGLNLVVSEQGNASIRTQFGVHTSRLIEVASGSYQPFVRLDYYHEFVEYDDVTTTLSDPAIGSFAVDSRRQQQDFVVVGLGVNTSLESIFGDQPANLFVSYDLQKSFDGYLGHTFSAGLKLSF